MSTPSMGSSTSVVMSPMWIILYQYHRLTVQLKQKVQNTAVCFIPSASRHKNCILLPVLVLQQLQWLPILNKSNTKLPAVTGSATSQLNYSTFIVCPLLSTLSHTHTHTYIYMGSSSVLVLIGSHSPWNSFVVNQFLFFLPNGKNSLYYTPKKQ